MYSKVISKFDGKEVEVFTNRTSFTGILEFHKHDDVLEVSPTDSYTKRRHGPAFIDQNAVVAIRLVKVDYKKWDEDSEDSGDSDDCDHPSVMKQEAKRKQKYLESKQPTQSTPDFQNQDFDTKAQSEIEVKLDVLSDVKKEEG